MTVIELTDDEARLFIEFRKRQEFIGHLVGYMESLNVFDLKNTSVTLDIDNIGIVSHMSVTRHFRK